MLERTVLSVESLKDLAVAHQAADNQALTALSVETSARCSALETHRMFAETSVENGWETRDE
jgi:hypothetical protein